MEELSLKELKAVLDDNELDLSMRQLSVVPTRALAKLPRATHLDFSNNQIMTVPPEFCLLTHITKLDLSNNRIVHLPNDFGKLVNLEHLDLYKNTIEELPLSFGELKSLKWLDVKGNPLQADLAMVAGECQNEKDCKMAAIKVVKFMKNKADETKRLVQKQKELNKQHEQQTDTTTPQTGTVASKEKAKKKKHKHKEANANNSSINTQNQSEGPRMQNQSKQTPNRTYVPNKPTSQSCLSRVFGLIRKLIMLSVIVALIGVVLSSFIIFDNCSQESHHWIPSSQPFCDDLHKLIQHRTLPTTFTKNLYQTLSAMSWVYVAKLRELESDIKEGEFVEKIQYYCNLLYMKLVAAAFVMQKYTSEWFAVLQKWYSENASDYVADFVDNVLIAFKMLLIIFSDFAVFIVEKGSAAVMILVDNVVYYMEHRDEFLRTVAHWWANLK